jgi:hypothetical protein
VTSFRQIEANRRNAQKSTGPKSQSGKQRSSKNAYRHGLAVPISNIESEAQLKDLSRELAEDASNADILALVERAAGAQLDLARVRKVRAAMIERAEILGAVGARSHLELEELRHRIAQFGWREKTQGISLPQPELLDCSTPLPQGNEEEEQRLANAVRPILSELTKICRYENRAAARCNRTMRDIISIKTAE